MKKIIFLFLFASCFIAKSQVAPTVGWPLNDFPVGGSIGTAANTVDKYSDFNINQTTAGQTITIPNPTNTTAKKTVKIRNVGSVSFTISGWGVVSTGMGVQADWSGSAYSIIGIGGSVTGTGTSGQVAYFNGTSSVTSEAALGYNATTNALTVGKPYITDRSVFPSTSSGSFYYNTSDTTTNYERARLYWNSNIFRIASEASGSGTPRSIFISGPAGNLVLRSAALVGGANFSSALTTGTTSIAGYTGSFTNSSGTTNGVAIMPTVNQTGSGAYRGIFLSPFEQTTGSGTKYLIDAGTNSAADGGGTHTSRFIVDNVGNMTVGSSPTTAASVTVNKGVTGSTLGYNARFAGTVQSDVTSEIRSVASESNTAASVFTLSDYRHFFASQGTIGAGSAITNQYGFQVSSTMTGAAANYAFYGNIPSSGLSNWNSYMTGTAPNYFAGSLTIGATTIPAKFSVLATTEQMRLQYDASNYISITVGSTGLTTFSTTGTASGMVLGAELISSPAGRGSSNFTCAAQGLGSSAISQAQLQIGGVNTVYRIAERGSTTAAPTAGLNYFSHIIGQQDATIAGSGTHPIFAQLALRPLSITAGAGSVTSSATVYIEGAATGATNNFSLWVAGGSVQFNAPLSFGDGNNIVFGTSTGSKICTTTSQKLGFWNATPIVQPSSTGQTAGFTAGAGTNATDQSTFTGGVGSTAYTIGDIVRHMKNMGLIAQ